MLGVNTMIFKKYCGTETAMWGGRLFSFKRQSHQNVVKGLDINLVLDVDSDVMDGGVQATVTGVTLVSSWTLATPRRYLPTSPTSRPPCSGATGASTCSR